MSNNEPIREYDTKGNLIHYKDSCGYETWREYDSNGNVINYKNNFGVEKWWEYDSNGKCIYYKNNLGREEWYYEGKITEDPFKILLLASQLHSKAS